MRRSGGRCWRGWNDTARVVPAVTVPGLFAAQVARAADAVAVVCGDACVSYGELDAAAERLAGVLAGLGAGPESVVAVVMGRSVQLVTALLAVLKAGAAYLPVDPGYPAGRVAFMLADARPGGGRDGSGERWGCWPRARRGRWWSLMTRRTVALAGAGWRRTGRCGARRGAGGGECGVCDLYVGVDGCAEGCGGDACGRW